MSLNGTVEDAEMTDDGEKVVTMMDVLQEQQEFEDDANAVLGASDDKDCTYAKGYIKRQAIYACLTCCTEAKTDPMKRAGVCLACSLSCHENHDLIELYTKRNFRCDCGNPKFNLHPCQFTPNKTDLNDDNIYDQNFSGLYCVCHRPYPDPEANEEDEMIQCIICEDWLHASHLEATVPPHDQYAEMVCKGCMAKNEFLHDYSMFAVHIESGDVDIVTVNGAEGVDKLCNGDFEKDPTKSELNESKCDSSVVNIVEEKGDESDQKHSDNKDEGKTEQEQERTNNENKELEVEPNGSNEPKNMDKITTSSENEEGKLSEKISNVQMETESENEKSAPEIELNERITETDSELDRPETATNSLKPEDIATIDSESEKSESIVAAAAILEKPDTITESEKSNSTGEEATKINNSDSIPESEKPNNTAEVVTEIEKQETISDSEKPESKSIESETFTMEMTESEKENALLEDTEDVQIGSENVMDTDDCKNNVTDSSSIESTASNTNIEDDTSDKSKSNTALAKSNPDSENIPYQLAKEGGEIDKVSTITSESTDNEHENCGKTNKNDLPSIESTSGTDIEKECTEISTSEAENSRTSTLETSDDTKSSTDKVDLPIVEDKGNNEAITKSVNNTDTTEANDTSIASENKSHDVEMNDIINSENESHSENKTEGTEGSSDAAKSTEIMDKHSENSDTSITCENKRKLSIDMTEEEISTKKAKLFESEKALESEIKNCVRPEGVKTLKGATFWPQNFRLKLCTCNECLTMYKDLSVLFLIDPEDTVTAYETLGKEKTDGGPTTQYEKGLQALSSLDRIQQINALTEYNKMRDKLLDFLKSFKDRREIVKEEDIKAFFAGMKPKREPDGVYFCR